MRITKLKMKAEGVNTMSLTGLSLLWGVMLGLISPWFSLLSAFCIAIGFGSEVKKVYE
jgi:hypothetical protein|tara:strand:+ start:2720 stop:2893 length:174 start_codon:yes stop_codon:yes gene_type:complete